MMLSRIPRSALIPLALLGLCAAGCNRSAGPDLTPEVARLTSELEATRLQLDTLEKNRAVKQQDAVVAAGAVTPKFSPPAIGSVSVEKDAQISALQTEIDDLKKRDVFAFAAASAAMQTGSKGAAMERYQQFLKDFPNSPLAADADRAIAELTTTREREAREARTRALTIDPRRPEREILQRFNDGTASVQEVAPMVKNRSTADIIKLLGQPNQTFRDGKELGYIDKIIDPATGGKGTLVIGFEQDTVSTLRIGYLGKPIKP